MFLIVGDPGQAETERLLEAGVQGIYSLLIHGDAPERRGVGLWAVISSNRCRMVHGDMTATNPGA
jgi:hypothetical protein